MEAVKAFNAEMVSMMDMKPPISRAKMMSITKAGIKAIKLYKHVVQIIEKFIKRCGPELKVPGLYVVDSIIRQSRHQFGEDKDVFGPRFLKNISETFHSLYQCPPDDKAKILRVLNLWQKNAVFGMDVIQPLLDMSAAPLVHVLENGGTLGGSPAVAVSAQPPSASPPVPLDQPISTGVLPESQIPAVLPQLQNPAALPHLQNPAALPHLQNPAALPHLQNPAALPHLQNPAALPHLQNPAVLPHLQNPAALPHLQNPAVLPHLQNPAALPHLQNTVAVPHQQNPVPPPAMQNPAALTAIAQFLQSSQGLDLQQVLQSLQQSSANIQPAPQNPAPAQQQSTIAKVLLDRFDYDEEPEVAEEPGVVEEPNQQAPAPAVNLMDLQQALQAHLLGQLSSQVLPNMQAALQVAGAHSMAGSMQSAAQSVPDLQLPGPSDIPQHTNHSHFSVQPQDVQMQSSQSKRDERDGRYHRQSRSRSPRRRSSSRSRRSRSGSRSHRSRYRRSRSRSRERWRASPRSRTDDRRERERKHKGLPPIKRETLSVCTTTLWIGQLDKKTQQQDISSLMEEFGQIESINMIPPRGCAYIVMVHRQDASTALNRLSRGSARINHKPFKIAWALNKGISSRFKKYWDVELGVTYVPWSKLKTTEIPALREGGMLDQDTFKPEWKSVLKDLLKAVEDSGGEAEGEPSNGAALAAAGPQVPAVSVDVAGSPAAVTPTLISPPHMHTADKPEVPPAEPSEGPVSQMDSPEAPVTSSLPAGTLVGERPGAPQHPPGSLPPYTPPFPNNVHPNMSPINMPRPNLPHPNMPPAPGPMMPQGSMFRERAPGPPGPIGPRGPRGPPGPPGRFRMPMPGPHEDFPPPREGFPHPGPIEGDHWNRGPPRNDWRNFGPNRGPEWFEEGPPFRGGGWSRGGPRGRGHFGN